MLALAKRSVNDVPTTTIDLLRHGACEGGEIFRGSTDVALSELGWSQMRQSLAEQSGWQRVIASSLQRCRLFAEQFAAANALPFAANDALREIDFGAWEGKKIVDVQRDYGAELRQFWDNPAQFTPPAGEPMALFRERVVRAADTILSEHRGEHVLLIAHGAVIRMLLCEWLQMPMTAFSNIAVPYAGLSRVRIYHRDNDKPWLQLVFHRGE
jgi:broad specificity phosphatase PhoE